MVLTDSSGEFEVAVSNDILWIKSRMPGVVQDGSSLVSTGLVSCLQDDHDIDLLCLRMTSREEAQAADPSCLFRSVFVADTDNAGWLARRIACRLSYTVRSELTSTPRSVFYESGRRARAMLERILAERRYRRIIAEYYTVAPLLEGLESQTSLILHDADHLTLDLEARQEPSLPRRAWLRHRAAQMRAFVKRLVQITPRLVRTEQFNPPANIDFIVRPGLVIHRVTPETELYGF